MFMKGLIMKRLFSALAVVGCLLASHAANAGEIWFAGTSSLGASGNWFMKVNYTPNAGGPAATALSGTLTLGSNTLNLVSLTVGPTTTNPILSIEEGSPNDRVSIISGLTNASASGVLSSFYSPGTSTLDLGSNPNATDSNIMALTKLGTAVSGTVLNVGGLGGPLFGNITLSGFVVAPEPGSIALLSGLGLVVGRRLLKRRAKKQETAV